MQVAQLTTADVPAYRRLMLHAYEHAGDAFTSTAAERQAEPEAWWARRIAGADGLSLALGAFVEGELVGTVAVEFSDRTKTRHKAHVIGMFVMAHCRGLGLGQALINEAVARTRARGGILLMTLTVTEGNAPAVHLYESCGFQAFGTEPMAVLTPTGYKAKVHMWLGLGEPGAAQA